MCIYSFKLAPQQKDLTLHAVLRDYGDDTSYSIQMRY